MLRKLTAVVIAAMPATMAGIATAAEAEHWPGWRGAKGDARSPVAIEFADGATLPVAWKYKVGEGHAAPVVADGKLFVVSKTDGQEIVTALKTADGSVVWERKHACGFVNQFGSGPRTTPLVAGGRLFTIGPTGILRAFAVADGKTIWEVDTGKSLGATQLYFGASTSPVLADGKLLVNVGGKDGGSVVAFDPADGKVIWKAGDDRSSYATPLVIDLPTGADPASKTGAAKVETCAVFTTFREVSAFRVSDGMKLWTVPLRTRHDENAVTPVAGPDGLVIVSSVSGGLRALRPSVKDGKPVVETAWHEKTINCYFSTPVLAGGRLYAVHNAPAQLSCIDPAGGKVLWTHPKEVGLLKPGVGLLHATVMTDGRHLVMLSDGGRLSLIALRDEGYKLVASSKVCGSTWVHPVPAEGRLFVRDPEGVTALELTKSAAAPAGQK